MVGVSCGRALPDGVCTLGSRCIGKLSWCMVVESTGGCTNVQVESMGRMVLAGGGGGVDGQEIGV